MYVCSLPLPLLPLPRSRFRCCNFNGTYNNQSIRSILLHGLSFITTRSIILWKAWLIRWMLEWAHSFFNIDNIYDLFVQIDSRTLLICNRKSWLFNSVHNSPFLYRILFLFQKYRIVSNLALLYFSLSDRWKY